MPAPIALGIAAVGDAAPNPTHGDCTLPALGVSMHVLEALDISDSEDATPRAAKGSGVVTGRVAGKHVSVGEFKLALGCSIAQYRASLVCAAAPRPTRGAATEVEAKDISAIGDGASNTTGDIMPSGDSGTIMPQESKLNMLGCLP